MVESTRVVSPWDGIVTRRGYHVGDFVRSGDAATAAPLLTVSETRKMRVIVGVPDADSPYLDKGDRAIVRFDALANPNHFYHGVVRARHMPRTSTIEQSGPRLISTTTTAAYAPGNTAGLPSSSKRGAAYSPFPPRLLSPRTRAVKPPVIASLTGVPGALRSRLVKKAASAWRWSRG